MARLVGLDLGSVRIGVAVSDEDRSFVFPVPPIVRQEGYRRDFAAIRAVVKDYEAAAIVVGMPVMMDGTPGVQADKVTEFVQLLRDHFRIPILVQDERLSTAQAHRALGSAGIAGKARKMKVDSAAAAIILQSYLDSAAATTPCSES